MRSLSKESLNVAILCKTKTSWGEDNSSCKSSGDDDLKKLMAFGRCPKCVLRGVNLSGVNLRSADLSEADLSGANLYKANLKDAILTQCQPLEWESNGCKSE